jgi:hypothetical protein
MIGKRIKNMVNSLLTIRKTCGSLLVIKKFNFHIDYWVEILFLTDHPSVKVREQKSLLPHRIYLICNLQIWK